jgi:hypothetical protein
MSRRPAEAVGVGLQVLRGRMQNAGRIHDLALKPVEQFVHPVGALGRHRRLFFLRGTPALDLGRRMLGFPPRRICFRECAADGVADEDQHGGLDQDGDGMDRDPQGIGAAGIDRGRQDEVQAEMMARNQRRRGHQHAPFAEAREHRQHGEIVEVHLDLPGMVAEQIHQDRGLADERNRKRKRDDRDRPLQPPGERGHGGERSGNQRGCQDRLAERPGNQRQHRHMDEGERDQRPRNDLLE